MRFFEFAFIAIRHIRRLKFRSWTTIIGIIISIMAIVALTAIGQGTQSAVLEQFNQIGANKAVILPAYPTSVFDDDDVNAIIKVDSVKHVIPFITESSIVEFKKEKIPALIRGLPTDKKSLEFAPDSNIIRVLEGRYLEEGDEKVAFISYFLAKGDELNKRDLDVGDKIFINGVAFRVIGIEKNRGGQSKSAVARIPLDDALKVFNKRDYTGIAIIFKDDVKDKSKEIEKIKKILRKERGIHEDDNDDFTIISTESILKRFNQVMIILQIVVIGIVSISLLIGGIGIANTMFASVLERTKEIGTLKAIGARNKDIFVIFLIEAGILGLVGGILGLLFGWLISSTVEKVAFSLGYESIKISIRWILVVASLLFSFFVGIISGVVPALRAMRLKPIEALRYE